jgi:putative ATPase
VPAAPPDLFEHVRARDPGLAPLAERMRPRSIDELVGPAHLVSERGLLRRIAAAPRLPSLLLWGPPGSGKTTIARLLAERAAAGFETVSAASSGVKELRAVVDRARERRNLHGRATVLFVDEIHRFGRVQQDALLPHVEAGVCTLIGATTENPAFEVAAPLLSRLRIVRLDPLSTSDVATLLARALADPERGLGGRRLRATPELLAALAGAVDGDARRALNALELAADLVAEGEGELNAEEVGRALGVRSLRYDKDADEHYDIASAFIKSMRASDPDAAVYWLARMLEAGEDPGFLARRIVIFAAEDVGNADPQGLVVATAAAAASDRIGMPEAVLPLTQATIYLALAAKSNATLRAYGAARDTIAETGALAVPAAVRNPVTGLARALGHGADYRYPHDFEGGVDPSHESHLPEVLRDRLPARRFVRSGAQGWEANAESALAARRRGRRPEERDEDP